MFKVGEAVFYPMHGVGWVDAIEERCVRGATGLYYVLCFRMDGMKVLLPVERAEKAGLRPLTPKAQAERAFSVLEKGAKEESFANWNRRYRFNMERMKKGDMESMAKVARSLYERNAGKGLSAGEKTVLRNAMTFLEDEYAAATGQPPGQVGKKLEELFGPYEK